jgi:hypothetical protein
VKKNIRPIIIDYDTTNRNLHVVDKIFLFWLASQNTDHLLEELELIESAEFQSIGQSAGEEFLELVEWGPPCVGSDGPEVRKAGSVAASTRLCLSAKTS